MSKKLLLADDSVTIQRVIEMTFSGEDVQVLAVSDGEEAIARIAAEKPDIVLADIGMPETERLRSLGVCERAARAGAHSRSPARRRVRAGRRGEGERGEAVTACSSSPSSRSMSLPACASCLAARQEVPRSRPFPISRGLQPPRAVAAGGTADPRRQASDN